MQIFRHSRVTYLAAVMYLGFSSAVTNILVSYDNNDCSRGLEASVTGALRSFRGSLNVTFLTSGVDTSMDEILSHFIGAVENNAVVVLGCLGSRFDKFLIHFAKQHSMLFICVDELNFAEASVLMSLMGHKYVSMGASLETVTSTIHGIAEEARATDVVLIGSAAHIFYALPSLLTKTNSIERQYLPLDLDDTNYTIRLSNESCASRLVVALPALDQENSKIQLMKSVERQVNMFPRTWLYFTQEKYEDEDVSADKVILVARPIVNVPDVVREALNLVTAYQENLNSTTLSTPSFDQLKNSSSFRGNPLYRLFDTQASSPHLDSNGQQINTVFSLTRLIKRAMKYVAVVKAGTLSDIYDTGFIPLKTRCRNPRAMCVVTIPYPPVIMVSEYEVKSPNECIVSLMCTRHQTITDQIGLNRTRYVHHCCIGYAIDILIALQRDLAFEAEIYLPEDERLGVYDESHGRWVGLVGELVDKKADMILVPLSTTYARSKVVDFSNIPLMYFETVLVMMERDADAQLSLFGFTRPFDSALWAAYLGGCLLFVFIIWLMDRYKRRKRRGRFLASKRGLSLKESFSYLCTAVFKIQVDDKTAVSPAARLTYAVFSLATLVLVSAYTANLTASLVEQELSFPITGIHDKKLQDPSFKLGVPTTSSTETLLKETKDETLRSLEAKVIYYQSDHQMLAELEMGMFDAVLSYTPFIQIYNAQNSSRTFKIIGEPINVEIGAFAFQKGQSRWNEKISLQLEKYQCIEYLDMLKQKWFYRWNRGSAKTTTVGQIGVQNLAGLFVVVACVSVICALLLVLETNFQCRKNSKRIHFVSKNFKT